MEWVIITNSLKNNAYGCALFPFIYVHKRVLRYKKLHQRVLNHERIHIRQQIELLVIPFLIWYYLEYLYYFLETKNWYKAYKKIRFERECFDNEKDMSYLSKRKPYNYLPKWMLKKR